MGTANRGRGSGRSEPLLFVPDAIGTPCLGRRCFRVVWSKQVAKPTKQDWKPRTVEAILESSTA
jgi:hypothetical protein